MSNSEQLPVGESVQIKVIVRCYADKMPQIFGVIISGAEHFAMPEGDTVMVVGMLTISDGLKVIDPEKWGSAMSREFLMRNRI